MNVHPITCGEDTTSKSTPPPLYTFVRSPHLSNNESFKITVETVLQYTAPPANIDELFLSVHKVKVHPLIINDVVIVFAEVPIRQIEPPFPP